MSTAGSSTRVWWAWMVKGVMFGAFLVLLGCSHLLEKHDVDYSLLLGGTSEDT